MPVRTVTKVPRWLPRSVPTVPARTSSLSVSLTASLQTTCPPKRTRLVLEPGVVGTTRAFSRKRKKDEEAEEKLQRRTTRREEEERTGEEKQPPKTHTQKAQRTQGKGGRVGTNTKTHNHTRQNRSARGPATTPHSVAKRHTKTSHDMTETSARN